MRVLYCTELFLPHIGGAEILAERFVLAMKERGYQFIVVTSQSGVALSDKTMYNGIPVYRFPFHITLLNRNLKELKAVQQRITKLRQAFKPDLVHLNSIGSDTFFHLLTTSAYPAPILATIHGLPIIPVSRYRSLVRRTFLKANWVAAVSKATLTEACQIEPQIISRSSVIYNGLDIPTLQPAPLPFDPPQLLCLGRLVPHKGFDLALTAFSLISKQFPEVRLVIAGDGPARPDLEDQACQMRLKGQVEFMGLVDPEKVPELINAATIVIMPSRREPFGLVALQAAQMARPIVATCVGGLPEVVLHKQTGLLVKKDDVTDLAQAIIFLLKNPELASQMGQAARTRAQELFHWEKFIHAYDSLYRKLVQGIA